MDPLDEYERYQEKLLNNYIDKRYCNWCGRYIRPEEKSFNGFCRSCYGEIYASMKEGEWEAEHYGK